ncbi:MAG: cytidine deaminase [Bacteroidales bacterium]|nr:cytidine deaminase [Bacteroidales bacterium]
MRNHEINICYKEYSPSELNAVDKNLIDLAIQAAKNAYAPYSHFRVGAAVLLDDGSIIKGSNQENAAYPSGLCAERVALFYANSEFPGKAVLAIAVVVVNPKGEILKENISPCGSCRQVMVETQMRFKKPIKILLASDKSVLVFDSVEDLLPLSFSQGDLLVDEY